MSVCVSESLWLNTKHSPVKELRNNEFLKATALTTYKSISLHHVSDYEQKFS